MIDETLVRFKKTPGPATYKPDPWLGKVKLGKQGKAEKLNFLTEVQYLGKNNPGVAKYKD